MKITIGTVTAGFVLLFMAADISDARAKENITAKSLFEKISKEQIGQKNKTSKSLNKAENDRKKLCKRLGSDLSLQTQLIEYVGLKNSVNPLKLSIVDVRLSDSASCYVKIYTPSGPCEYLVEKPFKEGTFQLTSISLFRGGASDACKVL